ncbi:MAG: hypothetical protein R6V33_07845 [Pelovirga sp.]
MTPIECLRRRFDAHRNSDFATVYASYHPQAPFLLQFQDLNSYLTFAREHLSSIRMLSWRCTRERRLNCRQSECLQIIEFEHAGTTSRIAELALVILAPDGWRYHSAQKLDPDSLSVPLTMVDFNHFDQADEKVRF